MEEHVVSLEKSLKTKTDEWIKGVESIIANIKQHITNLNTNLEEKKSKLCDETVCPEEIECSDNPKKICLKYKQK